MTSTVPPPRDLASATAPPKPRLDPGPAGYDRARWERALIAAKLPHHSARILGWGLAHLCGTAGYLPPGAPHADRLAERLRMSPKQVRMSLHQLEQARLISRPDIRTWTPCDLVRPLTLTVP
ncbi:hypothetical protein [Streptomyces sp. NPDC088789]|uniref:hypothetical protein n=1 Tax=Streptomyces sp. NPDC088789 TaxID=3365899 RepID=UPI00381EE06B